MSFRNYPLLIILINKRILFAIYSLLPAPKEHKQVNF